MLVIALSCVVLWFGMTIAKLENENYALRLGMCPTEAGNPPSEQFKCLRTVETRTSIWWHLYYALTE